MESIQRTGNTKEKLLKDSRVIRIALFHWMESNQKCKVKNFLKTMYYEGKEKDYWINNDELGLSNRVKTDRPVKDHIKYSTFVTYI